MATGFRQSGALAIYYASTSSHMTAFFSGPPRSQTKTDRQKDYYSVHSSTDFYQSLLPARLNPLGGPFTCSYVQILR